MSEEERTAFQLIRDSLNNIGAVITSIRAGQLQTERALAEHSAQIARDLTNHQAKMADDLVRNNEKLYDRINGICETCADHGERIIKIETKVETQEKAEEAAPQKKQAWGAVNAAYIAFVAIVISLLFGILDYFKH